jgi:hypothetical protein
MCEIPASKRALFGNADIMTGQAGVAIIGRSSLGPSLHVFKTDDMTNPEIMVPSKPLVYYPIDHPTLGTWDNKTFSNPSYNMTTKVYGVVYPENSKYVYFIGTTGLGIPAYGAGSDNPDDPIYDPVDNSKGCHAWPYVNYLWIYNEDDLVAVFNGSKMPWEIKPEQEGVIDLPYYDLYKSCGLSGVSYDSMNKKLYISAKHRNETRPVIHVYEFKDK